MSEEVAVMWLEVITFDVAWVNLKFLQVSLKVDEWMRYVANLFTIYYKLCVEMYNVLSDL